MLLELGLDAWEASRKAARDPGSVDENIKLNGLVALESTR